MRFLFYTIIAITLFSCGTEPAVLSPIIGSGTGDFRGSSIGDNYERVLKNAATDNPLVTEEGVISCEFQVENSNLVVRYEFDEEKLYSIQADIFFADTASLSSFFHSLEDRMTSQHGDMSSDGGFLVWKDKSSGTEVEFTLADESIEFGRPKLSLTIYNFDY
jgi:hypothetical protein